MSSPGKKVLLLNPPHTAIGSRIPREQLPPLGLLSIGGPLIDAGFQVQLLDAEFGPMHEDAIITEALAAEADAVLMGHSGSTSAHDTIMRIAKRLKAARPDLPIVYGGVYPSYHWEDVLRDYPQVDYIVRGEGERTARDLLLAMFGAGDPASIDGIALRVDGKVTGTQPAEMIKSLDDYRVGWELIDHSRYSYWGGMRAVVVQFSRGCPYLCSYCGQRGFWTQWRHRDRGIL